MPLPEISRRCLSCGAAVRAGARFCPQCGKPVGDAGLPADPVARSAEGGASNNGDAAGAGGPSESAGPTTRDADVSREWVTPTREFSAFVEDLGFDKREEKEAARAASDEKAPEAKTTEAGFDPAKTTPMTRPTENVAADSVTRAATDGAATGGVANAASGDVAAGASAAAADDRSRVARVREDARARAERVRERARVAFDDSPEDASARFVVAAVVLFLVFLVFLFLSLKVLR
jgi:cobalamin biosynthesis Mg chelatase CobN